MRVGLDVQSLTSGHKYRGIGGYTAQLVKSLQSLKVKDFHLVLLGEGKILPDVDLIHYPYFDFFRNTLPLIKRKKTIVTIHDVTPLVFPVQYPPGLRGSIGLGLQKTALKNVSAVIADSVSSKKDIIKYLKYPAKKIDVIYLAASAKFRPVSSITLLRKVRNRYRLPKEFILYVGDVNYNKNLTGLAKACSKINYPLVVVGKQAANDDFDKKHIENQPLVEFIKLFGKKKNVFRLGFVPEDDLICLYNLATVYCQPSFYEGFGLPVLEAMAAGLPVVLSNRSSLPEIAGEAAVYFDPYDSNDIVNKLDMVIKNNRLRESFVKKGLARAKNFTWQKVASETYEVYKKTLRID